MLLAGRLPELGQSSSRGEVGENLKIAVQSLRETNLTSGLTWQTPNQRGLKRLIGGTPGRSVDKCTTKPSKNHYKNPLNPL